MYAQCVNHFKHMGVFVEDLVFFYNSIASQSFVAPTGYTHEEKGENTHAHSHARECWRRAPHTEVMVE